MQTTLKSIAVSALFLASTAGAATVERTLFGAAPARATCSCKGKGDCTCPKGQCKCKSCGNHAKVKPVFETLQGNKETTVLPDTARYDARGGVFI
ncbi:MAG TPA: hypothetical protein VGD87_14145 [Archangium sp.]